MPALRQPWGVRLEPRGIIVEPVVWDRCFAAMPYVRRGDWTREQAEAEKARMIPGSNPLKSGRNSFTNINDSK
jgi:hypothetical protein